MIQESVWFWQQVIGAKSTNALIGLVYKKQLRVSLATNKLFRSGEIINFVQTDAQKLQFLSSQIPLVSTFPFLLTFCLVVLFYELGISFVAGISIFIIAFVVNILISKYKAKLQKSYMKKQDTRISMTSECLNNIKMLKLYSWTDIFFNIITERRNEELAIFHKSLVYGVMVVSTLYFFPLLLQSVSFTTYIGLGNQMTLAQSFMVLTILSLIQRPIR